MIPTTWQRYLQRKTRDPRFLWWTAGIVVGLGAVIGFAIDVTLDDSFERLARSLLAAPFDDASRNDDLQKLAELAVAGRGERFKTFDQVVQLHRPQSEFAADCD